MLPLTVIIWKNKHMILKLLNCTAIYFSPSLAICFNIWSASMFAIFSAYMRKLWFLKNEAFLIMTEIINESGSNSKKVNCMTVQI